MNFIFNSNAALTHQEVEITTAPNQEQLQQRITLALGPLRTSITLINPLNNRDVMVTLDQVMLVQSEERMCHTLLNNNSAFLWNSRLKDVEKKLASQLNFIKINKTTMINIFMVESFNMTDNFRIELYLINGHKEIVNRSFTKLFKERITQHAKSC